MTGRPERKSLMTLQASPHGNGLNGGKQGCHVTAKVFPDKSRPEVGIVKSAPELDVPASAPELADTVSRIGQEVDADNSRSSLGFTKSDEGVSVIKTEALVEVCKSSPSAVVDKSGSGKEANIFVEPATRAFHVYQDPKPKIDNALTAVSNLAPKKCSTSVLSVTSEPCPAEDNDSFTEVNISLQSDAETDFSASDSAFFDQDVFNLMGKETIPETYWADLAEERRRALEETLDENRKLSLQVAKLKKENSRLLLIAEEAAELRKLVEGALAEDEDTPEQPDEAEEVIALASTSETRT